jgi:hypothetical protein
VDIPVGSLFDRAALLVYGWFPDSDSEWMSLVDGLLPVLQGKALGIASLAFIILDVLIVVDTLDIAAPIR